MEGMPKTHYEWARSVDEPLLRSLRDDLTEIKESGLAGPVYSCKQLPGLYPSLVIATLRNSFAKEIGIPRDAVSLEEFLEANKNVRSILYHAQVLYFSMLNFELFGKRTFYVADNLATRLSYTELKINSDFVRLPFKSCMFVYSSPEIIGFFKKITGINHPVTNISVYLTELNDYDIQSSTTLHISVLPNNGSCIISRSLLIKDGRSLSESLRTDWHDIYARHGQKSGNYGTVEDSFFFDENIILFRTIINTILYISSSDPDMVNCLSVKQKAIEAAERSKKANRKNKWRNKAKKLSALDYTLLGEKTPNIIIEKPAGTQEVSKTDTFYKLAARFIVRGHWRNQPYGEGLSKTKIIWIQPYWKGPDMGRLLSSDYTVK